MEDLAQSGAFTAADLQIQCSQWQEAFCLAVAEGMRASLPVVVSDIGGLPELVEDGVNGFLFPPRDPAILADRILRLAAHPELRREMGMRGRERALTRHNLQENARRWADLVTPGTYRAAPL